MASHPDGTRGYGRIFNELSVIMPPHDPSVGSEQLLGRRVDELERELGEAHLREAATAEILRVISYSKGDAQPVFDTIVRSALRLCDGLFSSLFQFDGNLLHPVAHHNYTPEALEQLNRAYPRPPDRGGGSGRAILDRAVVEILDVERDREYRQQALSRAIGWRSGLFVPMLRDGAPIGVIMVARSAPGPFSGNQVELLKTFADQAVIAVENTRLFEAEQASKRELQVSLEYQTSISSVLAVISRSPTDVQPVLDTIARIASNLGSANDVAISLREDDELRITAHYGPIPIDINVRRPIGRNWVSGRAVMDRRPVHVLDLLQAGDEFPLSRQIAQRFGHRTTLGIPLLRSREAIGCLLLRRNVVEPFTDKQIELLNTFADQAVIAIENTRLFQEVRERTRELTEALEQRTATSEVLSVISSSPRELQPVFEVTLRNAVRICGAKFGQLFLFEGNDFRAVATRDIPHAWAEFLSQQPAIPADPKVPLGRVAATKGIVHIADITTDQAYIDRFPPLVAVHELGGARTLLVVPMLKGSTLVGAIGIFRQDVRPFTSKQIELVETFADQAVIAIENTRLFDEVQARTRELQEALKQQTATADVLKVISRSAFDLQPVLQTLVENAVKLGAASWGHIYRFDGEAFRNIADYGASPEVIEFWQRTPLRPGRGSGAGRAAVERRTVHIPDVLADAEYQYAEAQKSRGVRSLLAVPMLRGDALIGVFALLRTEVRPFIQSEIELVETFADQAVIAIENTSLFEEVRARNRDLTALSEVGRAVSSTLDLKVVLKTVVERAVDLSGTDAGSIYYYREETGRFELGETIGLDAAIIARLSKLDTAARYSGLGEAIAQKKPLLIPDLMKRESNPLRAAAIEAGFRAALIVPLLSSDGPLGTLVLQRRRPGEFPEAIVSLMQSFADQSAIALENARLFEEIAQKSRELEIASQHKSQFVANMSHELRTPLAAILGYAELMQEGFYEPLGQKSLDALTRIRSNGKHLLGLINTILDIAKIESGQFTLNVAEYALENVVETVRSATESLAQSKKLALKTVVAKPLPIGVGDEQRLTQVLLNLVGNAIKFTDVGEVRVTVKAVDGHFNVSVADTGPGIPMEHQARIFEQFHQVDSSDTKAKGGTGLGLAIAKQIVEIHGGRIWVQSTVGKGSTFHLQIPMRAAAA